MENSEKYPKAYFDRAFLMVKKIFLFISRESEFMVINDTYVIQNTKMRLFSNFF